MEIESNIKSWSKPILIILSSKQTLDGCDPSKVDGTDDGLFPGVGTNCASITS